MYIRGKEEIVLNDFLTVSETQRYSISGKLITMRNSNKIKIP